MNSDNKWIKLMTSEEFSQKAMSCDTVLIPTGATEVYGPHLPLGSDILVSIRIADMISKRLNVMIGPCLEIGDSSNLYDFPGTMCLRPETWRKVMYDIVDSLRHWGFKNFLFLNMHAGNVPMIDNICDEYQNTYGIKCYQVDWWRFVQPKSEDICVNKGWMAHGHASECGTSVMLFLYPELVEMDKALNEAPIRDNFSENLDIKTYVPFIKTSAQGSLGDATIATRDKGEAIVTRCVDRIVEFMQTVFFC